MNLKEFGSIVMARRKTAGLSQFELGDIVGISRNYVSLIERGKAPRLSVDVLIRLSRVLDIRVVVNSNFPAAELSIENQIKETNRTISSLEDRLNRIRAWAEAYPLDAFPEPDMVRAREVLEAAGLSLDEITASNIRHVIKRLMEESDIGEVKCAK